jgi:hypothetical protein
MKWELLGEQIMRVATDCAKRCGLHEDDADDCAVGFLHRKFDTLDLSGPAWKGEQADKLTKMAMVYARGQLMRLRQRAKKEVSLTGPDGGEASGPGRELVSRLPGPEEMALRSTIREHVEAALNWLTPAQIDLYWRCFEQEERAIDIKEARGCSAEAIRQARARLRLRLRKLLITAGLDSDTVTELLNELDRLRSQC